MKFKKWIPGIMLGAMMTAMVTVPVMAGNINSGSTPPRIEFSRVSSTSVDSSSGDDSGKVYDFKDSKTSGVKTVTKIWDDSLSNDERPVPDISISTAKPSKNPLGYTITYHGNGLTFADGSSENEIVVNSSGKILSGSFKLPDGLFAGWYSDKTCTKRVKTDSNGLPVDELMSDMDLYAKSKTFVLKTSFNFNNLIPSAATSVVFTNKIVPTSAKLIDVDADGDGGVVAWMDGNTMNVSSQTPGQKIIASSCYFMFSDKSNLISIDFNNLDTSNVTNMSGMFEGCRGLVNLDLTPLNTQNVTSMRSMFSGCSGLTNLDLTPLDTSKVTDMGIMFRYCSGLTSLNLTTLDTQNVKNMNSMFSSCSGLTNLDLTPLDTSNVTDMNYMFGYCSSLTNLDLTHLDTQNVKNMGWMFAGCSELTSLDLTHLDTQNVTDMNYIFGDCSGLANLDLTHLDTQNVKNMSNMFSSCSGLTNLDLTHLDTSNVTDMDYMFYNCSALTTLFLGNKFAFVGSDYDLPSGTWYSSSGTAYTSDGTTCTIPNNKADTYTRR